MDKLKSPGIYDELDADVQAAWVPISNAAIDAFLASLCEDEDMVERVAKAIWESDVDAGGFHATWEAQPRIEKQNYRTIARAAIATLKQEAGQ